MAETMQEAPDNAHDIRPLVARATGNRGAWIFAAILLAAGGGIFFALQMRRMDLTDPSLITPQQEASGMITSPPELMIPQASQYQTSGPGSMVPLPGQRIDAAPLGSPDYRPQSVGRYPAYNVAPLPGRDQPGGYQPFTAPSGPAFAYQAPSSPLPSLTDASAAKLSDGRVEARTFKNPGTTVPQGSVIQVVMETALDSTRAGFARAIVSRDVESFNGTRVLIPKGSRLFGEYQADLSLGQNRALIQWRRLTRPDGTIIDLDSPSADPLGRAGVKGKVNTHFFQRFSGAILQSVLDLGVRAATREVGGDTVIVGLPGATTQATTIQNPVEIKPTLKIAQGASVSVFVARDLDFTAVER